MYKILILISLISAMGLNAQDLEGTWKWQAKQGEYQTTLELTSIDSDSYEGTYCSIYYNGSKIDCRKKINEICLNVSKVNTNIYEGTFQSPAFNGFGSIRITYLPSSDTIKLEILFSNGEFYLPDDVVFK